VNGRARFGWLRRFDQPGRPAHFPTSVVGAYPFRGSSATTPDELVYGNGRREILLEAASDRQAGRLYDAASRFVRRHPGCRSGSGCETTRA
jgi:hypothetical protein